MDCFWSTIGSIKESNAITSIQGFSKPHILIDFVKYLQRSICNNRITTDLVGQYR